jgi:predicted small lipoprotein YifL
VRPSVRLLILATTLALLAACGHRGALYVPGKPGDPVYDREHHGEPAKSGTSGAKSVPQGIPPVDDKTNGVNDSR